MTDDITKIAKRALELDEFFVEPKYMCGAKELIECREILPQLATAYLELKEKYDRLEKKLKYVTKAGQTALGMAAEMASQIDDLEGKGAQMTRQFKKELIEEVFLWIQEAMQAGADKRHYDPNVVKIQVLEALAEHGALSENAYQQEPLTGFVCPKCFFAVRDEAMIGKHYKPFSGSECEGKFVPVKEVKE